MHICVYVCCLFADTALGKGDPLAQPFRARASGGPARSLFEQEIPLKESQAG